MKNYFCVLLGLAVGLTACSVPNHDSQLETILQQHNVPGMQCMYYQDNGWLQGKQQQLYVLGDSISSQSVFQAASLSKVVFAYTVLRLVDQGVLDLDTPLVDYYVWPRFAPDSLTQALASQLTARHVLTHRTGLPNWAVSPSSDAWPTSSLQFLPETYAAASAAASTAAPSATDAAASSAQPFHYSGEGFAYLQQVVEHITGLSLNQLAEREVFTPMGMTSSWYGWRPSFEATVTRGHRSDGTPTGIVRYARANSAYTLMTCAPDYMRFLKALVKGEGLRPETFRSLTAPAPRVYEQLPVYWGLGVSLTEDGAFWHWGDNGSFKCFFAAYPNRILVYFTNSYNGIEMLPDVLPLFFPEGDVLTIPEWIRRHDEE